MEQKRVFKNAVWIIGTQIVKSILGLVISVLTARYLGPSNFGLINYAASLVAFAIPIMQLGFTSILVQELVNNPEEEGKILGTAVMSSFISSLLCVAGVVLFVYVANAGETETLIVSAIYSVMLVFEALGIISYWFQAKLLSKYTSIVSLIAYFSVSAYKIFLLVTSKSIRWFAFSNALDYIIISLCTFIVYKKLGGSKLSYSISIFKRMIKKSKYYILSGIMITIFSQTDKIMLKFMIGDQETGFYSAAVAIAGMSYFVFGAILDSARPLIFESKKESEQEFEKNVISLYSIVIYLALLQSIFITLLARPLIYILYGEAYMPATNSLRVIVWYTIFTYLGSARNIWLLAVNQQKLLWKIDVSGAIFNVVLNAIMIPFLGGVGAALASLLTQFFTNVIVLLMIKNTRVTVKYMVKALSPMVLINLIKSFKKELLMKK